MLGISRPTGYAWVKRDLAAELELATAVQERSRKPKSSPTAISEEMADLIVEARKAHPRWDRIRAIPLSRRAHPTGGRTTGSWKSHRRPLAGVPIVAVPRIRTASTERRLPRHRRATASTAPRGAPRRHRRNCVSISRAAAVGARTAFCFRRAAVLPSATASMSTQAEPAAGQLHRSVGFYGLMFVSLGSIIGSGWLLGALNAAEVAGPASIISWLLAAAMLTLLALVYAELGATYPVAGGSGASRTTRTARSPASPPAGRPGCRRCSSRRSRCSPRSPTSTASTG